MAAGKQCPQCGHPMYAAEEQHAANGSWIVYVCRSSRCGFREKVFESKRSWHRSVLRGVRRLSPGEVDGEVDDADEVLG